MAKKGVSESHDVFVENSPFDHGHFANNSFVTDCEQDKQHIPYYGVNFHVHNCIFE